MGLNLVNPRVWAIVFAVMLIAFVWGRIARRVRTWRERRKQRR